MLRRLSQGIVLVLLGSCCRSLLTNAFSKVDLATVDDVFYNAVISPAVSEAAYNLNTVQWGEDLVDAAKTTLQSLYGDANCSGKAAVFDTNNASYSFGYLASGSCEKCVQAINYWYYWGGYVDANHWGAGLPVQNADAVMNQTNMAAFAGMMWDAATSAGCALKICVENVRQPYIVVCHFSPLREFVMAWEKGGNVTAKAISDHVPKQPDAAKRCPRVILTDPFMTLQDIVDMENEPGNPSNSNLNVTVPRLTCYHDQYFYQDQKQPGVPVAVPCPEVQVSDTCAGLEMMTQLSEEDGNCPTVFIADPQVNTLDGMAKVYNKYNDQELTASDLCCYNALYNTPDYGFCGDIAPLQRGNSYVVVPCPERVNYRAKCNKTMFNGTTLDASDIGLYQCPDFESVVAARNDFRSYRGLSKLTWNKDFEAALIKDLKENNNAMAVCNNPFAANLLFNTPESQGLTEYEQYVWFIGTLSGNTATPRCTNAALSFDVTAQNWVSLNQNFEIPDAFYDSAASLNTFMYAAMKPDSKSFACVLLVCDTFFVNVVCLYDTTWVETGQPDSSDWWLNLPANVTTCPIPHWPVQGDTYKSIAKTYGLEVQEVMCYHGQAATHNDAQTRWAYGIPLAIPCKSETPERITCEAYNLYQGTCNITYTGQPGDSFENVPRSRLPRSRIWGRVSCVCITTRNPRTAPWTFLRKSQSHAQKT